MADVLIKGMEMPPSGAYSAEIGVLDEQTAVIVICTPIGEPQRGYRLVEVLPHGQLVDRDRLLALMSDEIIQRGGDERSLGIAWAHTAIELAPVVLEASKE